jgi:alpha,alpha-trehalase
MTPENAPRSSRTLDAERFDGVLFDMDGVLTSTARLHAEAWKVTFDALLLRRARARGEAFRPFRLPEDYLRHVDGRARADGVRAFLHSRGIDLPEGESADAPDLGTVHGLATRKNDTFEEILAREGAEPFADALALLRALRERGLKAAVVSASRNAPRVLAAAGLEGRFDARVDGNEAARLRLSGKPSPDTFLEAARRLGAPPARLAVLEDAEAGVRAGRSGGFGLIVGVRREGPTESLEAAGADVVVRDLRALIPAEDR